MDEKAKILNQDPSGIVVQLPGRRFPGVVVQGDTLKSWQEVATEVVVALSRGESGEARDAAQFLLDTLNDRLARYEDVLKHQGIGLPYASESTTK